MNLAVRTMMPLMLALAPGSASPQGAGPGDDKTVIFTPDDPEMAATAQALASLDDFLALSEAPPSDTDRFKLKVKVRDGNVTEHFWVIPFRRTETGFVGILANQPGGVHNVVLGQNIEFTRDDNFRLGILTRRASGRQLHRLRHVRQNVERGGGLYARQIRLRLLTASVRLTLLVLRADLSHQRCRRQHSAHV